MGLVVSTFGDHLGAELPSCLPVLVDRMGNEITRLTAVKVCGSLSSLDGQWFLLYMTVIIFFIYILLYATCH